MIYFFSVKISVIKVNIGETKKNVDTMLTLPRQLEQFLYLLQQKQKLWKPRQVYLSSIFLFYGLS